MITTKLAETYFKALLTRNPDYDGKFFAAVKTTGIFCRSVCAAPKPQKKNTEFFETASEALCAGYRCCKVCRPLSHENILPKAIAPIVAAVEKNPEKHWNLSDFKQLSRDAENAQHAFTRWSGMTYAEYVRYRRLGLAFKAIRQGRAPRHLTQNQDALSIIFGDVIGKGRLNAVWIDTPLGPMIAVADAAGLYLLEFTERRALPTELSKLREKKGGIFPETNPVLDQLTTELDAYFKGDNLHFTVPTHYVGSQFQREVWDMLRTIPAGKTSTYGELAERVGRRGAARAVGTANGANPLALIVPCHRIVPANKAAGVGNYGGKTWRKEWLLEHENTVSLKSSVSPPQKRKKVSAFFSERNRGEQEKEMDSNSKRLCGRGHS